MTFQATILALKLISAVKLTKSELTGQIVGGKLSNIENFPHAVYVFISCNGRKSSCGASILNQALLLTAAHCVDKCKNNFAIKAYTGSERRLKGFENNVVSIKTHEGYDSRSKANDIALLKLENDLIFGSKVKRIALVKELSNHGAKTAVVAGWGWTDSMGTKTDLLKHASQQVISRQTCIGILKRIPVGTICGRELEGVSYPERGDSGSALVVDNFIQIGIVSFKKRQYTNGTVVYTDVPYFYDWIKKNAEEMYCDGERKESRLRKGKEKK